MSRTFGHLWRVCLLVLSALWLVNSEGAGSCFSLGPTESGTTTDASGQPTLSSGDFGSAPPCSDRNTLPNDTAFLDAVEQATQLIHIHKQYVNDANLPAVCGLPADGNSLEASETGWDPASGTDVSICYTLGESLSAFFVAGSGTSDGTNNAGICRSNFGFESENTADGLPRSGTYRLDACVDAEQGSYRFRTRVVVSGADVNKTLAQIPLENVTDLKVFGADGAEATTVAQAKDAFAASPYSFTFTIRSGEEGANTHLTAVVQMICVRKDSTACSTPTQACD